MIEIEVNRIAFHVPALAPTVETPCPALGLYSLYGAARLLVREGYDGPSSDDHSGPSRQQKRQAEAARITAEVGLVAEAAWLDQAKSLDWRHGFAAQRAKPDEMTQRLRAAPAIVSYFPTDPESVRRDGAPAYDVLSASLRIGEATQPLLEQWLTRAAERRHLMPHVLLRGLRFLPAHDSFGEGRVGLAERTAGLSSWSAFVDGKEPAALETYSITFGRFSYSSAD